jgi:hypothetical protein
VSVELIEPDSRRSIRNFLSASHEQTQQRSEKVDRATRRVADALVSLQHPDGYWCGELTRDSTLESGYILLQLWMHPLQQDGSWQPPGPDDADTRGTIVPRNLLDQYAATMAQWLGFSPANLSSIFPNLVDFPTSNIGFLG